MSNHNHKQRITNELIACGVSSYGLHKFSSHHLPLIIHDDEHIMGVVYGRFHESFGLLDWVDRMLLATNRRIISLNHKPGYTDIDEFTYDVVTGISSSSAGPFTAITLNTKIKSISIRFVKKRCAEIFMHAIEQQRLEKPRL
jgi:hypothetical protein